MGDYKLDEIVRIKRRELMLTQDDLARLILKAAGTDPRDDLMAVDNYRKKISRWETKRTVPRADDFVLLSVALKSDISLLAKYL